MKKILALCLALAALLGVLSGCDQTTIEPTETTPVTEATEPAEPAGTLYVSFGAALELVYDETGVALQMTGTNEAGKALADAKQDQLNKGCVYVLRSVLRYAIDNDLLGDAETVAVRIGKDDPLPTEDFLDTIVQDCQYLIDEELAGLDMISFVGDQLAEDGNLTYASAKKLADTFLGADASGEEIPADGVFTFTAGEKTCTVDAFTGLVIGQ